MSSYKKLREKGKHLSRISAAKRRKMDPEEKAFRMARDLIELLMSKNTQHMDRILFQHDVITYLYHYDWKQPFAKDLARIFNCWTENASLPIDDEIQLMIVCGTMQGYVEETGKSYSHDEIIAMMEQQLADDEAEEAKEFKLEDFRNYLTKTEKEVRKYE